MKESQRVTRIIPDTANSSGNSVNSQYFDVEQVQEEDRELANYWNDAFEEYKKTAKLSADELVLLQPDSISEHYSRSQANWEYFNPTTTNSTTGIKGTLKAVIMTVAEKVALLDLIIGFPAQSVIPVPKHF